MVYSTTLAAPATRRTRIERNFDPDDIRRMKAAAGRDLMIGGPGLAAHALRAGGGKRCFPQDVRLDLSLAEERRFAGGMVFLRYRIRAEEDG